MDLARSLIQAVLAQDFGSTTDAWRSGQALDAFPSIDLAVVSFAPGRAPRWANVLFSREHPLGLVAEMAAEMAADAGAIGNIRFDADQRDATFESPAWLPGADSRYDGRRASRRAR